MKSLIVRRRKLNELYTDFLKLLSDFLANRPSNYTLTQELTSLAQSHQVLPIIYYQTKDELMYQSYLQAVYFFTQRKGLIQQITKAFSDIPFFIVKGMSISNYYPIPYLRTMGDSDIVVHECDKKRQKVFFYH